LAKKQQYLKSVIKAIDDAFFRFFISNNTLFEKKTLYL